MSISTVQSWSRFFGSIAGTLTVPSGRKFELYVEMRIVKQAKERSRMAAKKRSETIEHGIRGYRFLIAEDEYLVASDAAGRLSSLGAMVLGPVSTLSDALDIVEEVELDGALLDIKLRGEMVYPLAALLTMKGIPFAFVTGYDDRIVPPFYRSVALYSKPTDWAAVACQVVHCSTVLPLTA
jgi:hypothetical protein